MVVEITFAVDAVALVSVDAAALETTRGVEAAGPRWMAVMNSGGALVQLDARVIVGGRVNVSGRTLAAVRAGRVDANGVISAPVAVRTAFRLALVYVCGWA